jgi:hypothetical protein
MVMNFPSKLYTMITRPKSVTSLDLARPEARLASRKAADKAAFDAYVTDACAGIVPTDKQFKKVDRAPALSRNLSSRPLSARVRRDVDSLGTNTAAARLELESASCNGISLRRRHF